MLGGMAASGWENRHPPAIAGVIWAIMVRVSRVYFGVHYPQTVRPSRSHRVGRRNGLEPPLHLRNLDATTGHVVELGRRSVWTKYKMLCVASSPCRREWADDRSASIPIASVGAPASAVQLRQTVEIQYLSVRRR